MAYIEGRQATIASQAAAVLWKECVEALSARTAGIVDRLCIRVIRGQADTLAEAPRNLHTSGIVASVETVID